VANPSHFAGGSSKIDTNLGAAGFAFGPATVAAVVKVAGEDQDIVSAGAGVDWALFVEGVSTKLTLWNGSGATGSSSVLCPTTDGWVLVACSKATGSVAPRFYKYIMSTLASSIANAGAVGNSPVPDTTVSIGQDVGGGSHWSGDIAVVGYFNAVLTDPQVAALCDLKDSCASWKLSSCKYLMILEYPTTLADQSGNSAAETSRSGVSAASTAPTTWLTTSAVAPNPRRRTGLG
jgi:hypothetical protein